MCCFLPSSIYSSETIGDQCVINRILSQMFGPSLLETYSLEMKGRGATGKSFHSPSVFAVEARRSHRSLIAGYPVASLILHLRLKENNTNYEKVTKQI